MASEPAPALKPRPIMVAGRYARTDRYQFSPKGEQELNFGTEDEPVLVTAPEGVSELVMQGRRCGDFYAEVSGPKGCRSAIGASPLEAYQRVAEKSA